MATDELAKALVDAAEYAMDEAHINAEYAKEPSGPELARAAVAATLRVFVSCCDYPTDRRSLAALAERVERDQRD